MTDRMPAHAPPTELDPSLDGQTVTVYRNLHAGSYSIRKGGRVVAHATEVLLEDAVFLVSEAGRARCLAEGRKNVHAFVRGVLRIAGSGCAAEIAGFVGTEDTPEAVLRLVWRALTYNPRDGVPGFHLREDDAAVRRDRPLRAAAAVALGPKGAACRRPLAFCS